MKCTIKSFSSVLRLMSQFAAQVLKPRLLIRRICKRTSVSKMLVLCCASQLYSTSGKSGGRGFVQFTPERELGVCQFFNSIISVFENDKIELTVALGGKNIIESPVSSPSVLVEHAICLALQSKRVYCCCCWSCCCGGWNSCCSGC